MEKTNFEKLRVYQSAEQLADTIWAIVMQWDHFPRDTVGKQMVRAADSIPANIAEGTGRGTSTDTRYFARIARGSLYETKCWLRRAHKRKLLTKDQVAEIAPLIQSLAPMLNAYLSSLSNRGGRTSQRSTTKVPRPKN